MQEKITTTQVEQLLTSLYGELNTSLTKNYPAKMYLGGMINQCIWMKNNQIKDAIMLTEQATSMTSDTIAVENNENGRIVHHPSSTSAVGSQHYSQHNVDALVARAERKEQEAQCHADAEQNLRAIYKQIFKEAYQSKAERNASAMPQTKVADKVDGIKERLAKIA